AGAADTLGEGSDHEDACCAALGDASRDKLATELKTLGADPRAGLRKKRQQASVIVEEARRVANRAMSDLTLADERARNLQAALNEVIQVRDAALIAFPEGLAPAL